jgi:AraC-like DNA-binding protein
VKMSVATGSPPRPRRPAARGRGAAAPPMPRTYAELAAREFPDAAAPATPLAAQAPAPDITLEEQLQQVAAIDRLEPGGWGLRLGRRCDAATHGALSFAALSAPTLARTLEVIEHFGHLRAPHVRFASRGDGRHFVLEIREQLPLADALRVAVGETLMLSLQQLLAAAAGERLREAAFHFAWKAPEHAARYAEEFDGTLRFDAPCTMLALPLPWLWRACPSADAEIHAVALRQLEVQRRRLTGAGSLVPRIEQLIAGGAAIPSLQEVAEREHLSTRTVIRHLRRAGTTYQELVDAYRRKQAEALLADPGLDVAEIAYGLGYADPANFGRACRRWFGVAPSFYRERRDAAPPAAGEASAQSDVSSSTNGRSWTKRRRSN